MKHSPIHSFMFHANDSLKHDIAWGHIANAWILENERDGLVSTHRNLAYAIIAMLGATFVITHKWTVTSNPYGE